MLAFFHMRIPLQAYSRSRVTQPLLSIFVSLLGLLVLVQFSIKVLFFKSDSKETNSKLYVSVYYKQIRRTSPLLILKSMAKLITSLP